MPPIAKPVPKNILRWMRRESKTLGGKAEISDLSGLSRPTISAVVEAGTALPTTIEKLEAAMQKSEKKVA